MYDSYIGFVLEENMLFIGKRGFERFSDELRALGYEPFALEPLPGLNDIVADHADTLICELDGFFFAPREVIERLPPTVQGFRSVQARPHGAYPDDVCLNALLVGDRLFARLESLSDELWRAAEEKFKLVNIKQGYAKCSALALGDCVITADRGLASALGREGIAMLLIPPGKIALEGCEYGFIGGASFFDKNRQRAVFFGSLPELFADEVRDFCASAGAEVVELSGELTDFGGAVIYSPSKTRM